MADDRGKYEDAWDRLRELERNQKRLFVALLAGFLVIPLVLGAIDRAFAIPETVRLIVGIPYMVATVVIWGLAVRNGVRIGRFLCPRCRNRFYGPALSSLTPGRTCGYCGLFVFQARD